MLKMCLTFFLFSMALMAAETPYLRRQGTATQLIVEGKPFLILGGELHNSSASSLEYMKPIWPRLVAMNLNCVLPVVSWELCEPEEGRFDFSLVDGLIKEAREHRLKLVLLWFGSWKNGVSSYMPAWVKTDVRRFPRVERKDGSRVEVLTPFSDANRDADTRAFVALMRHLKKFDGRHQTVIMVQVENEIGTLDDSRDRSALAEEMFSKPVPAELLKHFARQKEGLIPEFAKYWEAAGAKTSGTWIEVFGDGADEALMAWQMARYVGHIAAAGKAEYALPMYVNAWLVQHDNQKAGQYPSGGPVSKVMDIWRAAAPSIDFLAPDIYLPDFDAVCTSYTRNGNPLFIPETGRGPNAVPNAFLAFGKFSAIGFCPFGIDSMKTDHPLTEAYKTLSSLAPLITESGGMDKIFAVVKGKEERTNRELTGYRVEVAFKPQTNSPAYALVVNVGPDEFVVAGSSVEVGFNANTPGGRNTRILFIEEGEFKNGRWIPSRRMNGDENGGGWRLKLPTGQPGIQRIKLYRHD